MVGSVKKQRNKAIKIQMGNREKLNELTDFLCGRKTITGVEFMELLNGGRACGKSMQRESIRRFFKN